MEGGGSKKNRDQKQIKLGIKKIFSHKAARNAAGFVAKTNNSRFPSPWVTKAVLTQNLKEVGGWGGGRCALPNAEPVAAKDAALSSSFLACMQELLLFTDKASSCLASFPSLPAAFLPPFLPCLPFFLPCLHPLLPSFLTLLPLLIGSMLISFLMPIMFCSLMPISFFLMPVFLMRIPSMDGIPQSIIYMSKWFCLPANCIC